MDDLNDWIGPNGDEGNSQALTPNLDRLVTRGVYFTNAHTAVPVCMASRLALMSGIRASTSGHYANQPIAKESVLRQAAMLPAYLRQHGYKTMGGGKLYHHGADSKTGSSDWDEVKPMYEMSKEWRQRGHNYGQNFFQPFPKGGSQIVQKYGKAPGYSLCGGPLDRSDMPRSIMPDEELADWAIERLKEQHEKPFFLAVGFARPHVPYTAPRKYFDLYDAASLKIPFVPDAEFNDIPLMGKVMALCMLPGGDHWFVTHKMGPDYWRDLVHAYLACVSFADDQIGRVLKALDESPYGGNTIVVLWSDHGQHLGEKKHWRKMCLWEESTRVPLILGSAGRTSGRRKMSAAREFAGRVPDPRGPARPAAYSGPRGNQPRAMVERSNGRPGATGDNHLALQQPQHTKRAVSLHSLPGRRRRTLRSCHGPGRARQSGRQARDGRSACGTSQVASEGECESLDGAADRCLWGAVPGLVGRRGRNSGVVEVGTIRAETAGEFRRALKSSRAGTRRRRGRR